MSGRGIWIVARGYYEQTVMCGCSTERAANAVRDKYNADPYRSDEAHVLWLPIVTQSVTKIDSLSLSVNLWDDGTADEVKEHIRSEWPFDMVYPSPHAAEWRWVRAPVHGGHGGRLDVHGTNHEAARRLFAEKRAEIEGDRGFRVSAERKGHVD